MFARPRKSLLRCPSCGHQQEESPAALSTFCRACGCHLTIAAGTALAAPQPAPFPFPIRRKGAQRVGSGPHASRSGSRARQSGPPRREVQLEFFAGLDRPPPGSDAPAAAPSPPVITSSGDHPALARMARRLAGPPKPGHRHVHCLECDFPQSIPVHALSTMCLRCTEPIPLDNFEIKSPHHRRIRTRGDVYLRRKGAVCGVAVQCHDLTIEGEFAGTGIDCDGEFVLLRNGTIACPVRCRRLVVRGGIEVAFLHPVHAQEAVIDGIVRGDLICERKLHLDRHSLLEGNIQTRSLSICEGARHTGMVSMPQLEERYAKFGEIDESPAHPSAGPARPATDPARTPPEFSLRPVVP